MYNWSRRTLLEWTTSWTLRPSWSSHQSPQSRVEKLWICRFIEGLVNGTGFQGLMRFVASLTMNFFRVKQLQERALDLQSCQVRMCCVLTLTKKSSVINGEKKRLRNEKYFESVISKTKKKRKEAKKVKRKKKKKKEKQELSLWNGCDLHGVNRTYMLNVGRNGSPWRSLCCSVKLVCDVLVHYLVWIVPSGCGECPGLFVEFECVCTSRAQAGVYYACLNEQHYWGNSSKYCPGNVVIVTLWEEDKWQVLAKRHSCINTISGHRALVFDEVESFTAVLGLKVVGGIPLVVPRMSVDWLHNLIRGVSYSHFLGWSRIEWSTTCGSV